MRKGTVIAALALGLVVSPAFAGDKSIEAFVDNSSIPGGANGFNNAIASAVTYSSGKVKSGGCKIKIALKNLQGRTNGDQLICIGSADVKATGLPAGGAGNSAVMTAVWDSLKNQAQGKADLTNLVLGCGDTDAVQWNGSMKCYEPDALYLDDLVNDPGAVCGGLWLAPVDPTNDNFLGVCQGVALGFQINPPSSGLIAQQGSTIPGP